MFKDNRGFLYQVVSGVLLSVIFALLCGIVFSAVASAFSLSDSVIKPVNQFIKTVAVFLGCFFRLRGSFGLFKGIITGAISELVILLVFCLFFGTGFNFYSLIDVGFCAVLGAIFGIITVNVKKEV